MTVQNELELQKITSGVNIIKPSPPIPSPLPPRQVSHAQVRFAAYRYKKSDNGKAYRPSCRLDTRVLVSIPAAAIPATPLINSKSNSGVQGQGQGESEGE